MLFTGLFLAAAALACAVFSIVALPVARVPVERRSLGTKSRTPVLAAAESEIVGLVDRIMSKRGWRPFNAQELDLAGVAITQSALVVTIVVSAFSAFIFAAVVFQNVFLAILLALMTPVVAKLILKSKTSKRRKAFTDQLDDTLQMLSSALRAGHSLPRALDTVSREAEYPTSEEIGRIVNENRLGRDLVDSMHITADRMQSEDFSWVADAVAIQRETGGNLSEILDKVGGTLRERAEMKAKVHSLSAEGRISAWVLMALPVVVGLAYAVINPGHMALLVTTPAGWIMLGISAVLYVVAYVWLSALTKVKF